MSEDICIQTTGFYGTYLNIAQNETIPEIDSETLGLLKDRGFTKFLIQNEDPVVSVKILSYVMSHSLLKPQRLLIDNDDYYVGIDMFTNTYYICYRDLMMIDIDRYKNRDLDTLEDIKLKLSNHPTLFFRIYSSRNGYHIFVLNKSMDYKSDESIRLMHELGCDFYYIVYSFLRGWSVRLNKKKGEENTENLYSWVGDVVRGIFFSSEILDELDNNINPEIILNLERNIDLEHAHIDKSDIKIQDKSTIEMQDNLNEEKIDSNMSNTQQDSNLDIKICSVSLSESEPDSNMSNTQQDSKLDTELCSMPDSNCLYQLNNVECISKTSRNKISITNLNEIEETMREVMPDSRLETLTNLHIDLTYIFEDVGLCSMPAPT